MRHAVLCGMEGYLLKNDRGRWEIVNSRGERVEITSGDVIELRPIFLSGWHRTRIEHGSKGYFAVTGEKLSTGTLARYIGR